MLWKWLVLLGGMAAIVTLVCTPLTIRWAHRVGAIDVPGGRKRHRRVTPRLGGIPILTGIAVALALAAAIRPLEFPAGSVRNLLVFSSATFMVFLLGVIDDIAGLRASIKFLVQVVAACLVVAIGWQFTTIRLPFDGPFQLGALGPIVSVVWIVGVTNAINLIDGLDGLAAGIVAIIGSSLLVLAAIQGNQGTTLVASCVVGACLGFLWHNWDPARIYLGDSGSLTLGFLLAVVSMQSSPSVKATTTLAILVPLLALGLPVIDTVLVMWSRFIRGHPQMKRLARQFEADREHVHHLLVDGRTPSRRVRLLLYLLAIVFCAMGLIVASNQDWGMGVAFLVVEVLAVILVRRLAFAARARSQADRKIERLDRENSGDLLQRLHLRESDPDRHGPGSRGSKVAALGVTDAPEH